MTLSPLAPDKTTEECSEVILLSTALGAIGTVQKLDPRDGLIDAEANQLRIELISYSAVV